MFRTIQASTAVALMLGTSVISMAPIVAVAPAQAQMTFNDVASNHWANDFIQEMSRRGVVKGFTDGSFKPDAAVTRAQFSSMLSGAFNVTPVRSMVNFSDVNRSFWAYSSIQMAYTQGFMSGFPAGDFRPNDQIPRAQALVSLANGLRYTPSGAVDSTLAIYNDANSIPGFAKTGIAAATDKRIVVNYPDVAQLNPNRTMTRAEAVAFIYQALNSQGQVATVTSPYIVGGAPQVAREIKIPAGTVLPVKYDKADKILLGKNEPKPTPIALTIAQNVVNSAGKVLIPAGSQVEGKLVVDKGVAQFMAEGLIMTNGQRYALDAISEKITQTETFRKGASATGVLKGSALGAAAAAGIAAVTGDRAVKGWEVLAGAGGGALAGLIFSKDKVELISIKPNTDLAIQLNSALVLPQ
jgi:S-layer homology domain